MSEWRLFACPQFIRNAKKELGINWENDKQLKTALEKIKINPKGEGKALRGMPAKLAGRIYRLHVGGRRKGRLIYFVIDEQKIIVPYFLSPIKSKFDYNKVDWEKALLDFEELEL